MNWKQRTIGACLWSIPLAAFDIAYMLQHGADALAFGFVAITCLPAWLFVGRNIDVKIMGVGHMKISGEEIEKNVLEKLQASAPETLKQVEEQAPALKQAAIERAALPSPLPEGGAQFKIHRAVTSLSTLRALKDTLDIWGGGYQRTIWEGAPNYALIALRIEIERRLNRIATILELPVRGLTPLIMKLAQMNVFSREFSTALHRLVTLGNEAAHGAVVDQNALPDIIQSSEIALSTLDEIISKLSPGGGPEQGAEDGLKTVD